MAVVIGAGGALATAGLRLDITIASTTSPQIAANAAAAHKIQFPSRVAAWRMLSPSEPISSTTSGMLVPHAGHSTTRM